MDIGAYVISRARLSAGGLGDLDLYSRSQQYEKSKQKQTNQPERKKLPKFSRKFLGRFRLSVECDHHLLYWFVDAHFERLIFKGKNSTRVISSTIPFTEAFVLTLVDLYV